MILRQPKWNPNKLHPKAKIIMERMTLPLEPLNYKLQELPYDFDKYS